MIKVLIVDDHEIVRKGIGSAIEGEDGISVVGYGSSGEEAVELAAELFPDVILMDVQMPGMGGAEAMKKIIRQNDEISVIAITILDGESFAKRLLNAGASGFLAKGCDTSEILIAIRKVHSGQRYISADVAQKMATSLYAKDGEASPFALLSERELQVMMLVVNCHKVQAISDQLSLSPKTVNSYRYRIFEKLAISSDVELTLLALRYNMINETAEI